MQEKSCLHSRHFLDFQGQVEEPWHVGLVVQVRLIGRHTTASLPLAFGPVLALADGFLKHHRLFWRGPDCGVLIDIPSNDHAVL